MSDIENRLRAWHTPGETITGDVALYLEAADEIRRLRDAIVSARWRLAKGRSFWNGPCHECDSVLESALETPEARARDIAKEELREERAAHGQFGVGA